MHVLLAGTGIQPIPPTGYGGVERTIAEYATALERAGHRATIVNTVRRRRSIDEYWFARELRRRIASEEFDVLHASTPVVANALAGRGEPFVYTSHSRHWFERDRPGAYWGYWLERRAVRRSVATVALTERLRAAMRAAVAHPPEELPVIPIGVDAERFQPDPSRRSGTVALGVGVVAPMKRWHLAAEGLRGTGLSLRIVGPIADAAYAAKVRAVDPAVQILGEVDDATLTAEYAGADVLVHPSRVELLAGVVLQGLAAGLPVLGADPVAGLAEEGVSGWTAPPGADERTIVDLLRARGRELAGSPELRQRMGAAARRRAVAEFSWASVVDRHVALYERLSAAGRLRRAGSRRR